MSSNSTSSPVQIPVNSQGYFYRRRRSDSVHTQSSGGGSPPALSPSASPVSTHSEVQTPHMPRAPSPPSPTTATSPILSYFFSPSSPVKSPFTTFPFSKSTAPLFEHEEDNQATPTHTHSVSEDSKVPVQGRHSRSMSMSSNWGPPRLVTPSAPSAEAGEARGAGVLRRLSLSGFGQGKPNLRDGDNSLGLDDTPRRARTVGPRLGLDIKSARAPSPMGERMLKGQFDAFH